MIGFKRINIFVITSIITVIGFVLGYITLNSLKFGDDLYITKKFGDESVLKDTEIRGVIQDNYSGVFFKINHNKLYQDFFYYNSYYDSSKNRTFYDHYISAGNYRIDEGYGATYRILKLVKSTDSRRISKDIGTHMVCEENRHHFMGRSSMQDMKAIELKDGKLYLVGPTCQNCKGKSGIYEVSDFDEMSEEGYKKLAEIDLEDGNVIVEGMLFIENNLCVILTEGNKMNNTIIKIKSFDLKTEKFSKDIEIPLKGNYYNRVSAYTNGNYLNLLTGNNVYTLKISSDISVLNQFDITEDTENEFGYSSVTKGSYSSYVHKEIADLAYKNDKLYVVSKCVFTGFEIKELINEKYLELIVWDNNSKAIFSGRIDANVDREKIWDRSKYIYNLEYLQREKYQQYFEEDQREFEQIEIY